MRFNRHGEIYRLRHTLNFSFFRRPSVCPSFRPSVCSFVVCPSVRPFVRRLSVRACIRPSTRTSCILKKSHYKNFGNQSSYKSIFLKFLIYTMAFTHNLKTSKKQFIEQRSALRKRHGFPTTCCPTGSKATRTGNKNMCQNDIQMLSKL